MKWFLIDSGADTGARNMEMDLAICGSCSHDEAIVRFYRWKPYCISLGKYQSEHDINRAKAEHDGLELVFRPTGGRAVLHAEELTYSVCMYTDFTNSPQAIYREINLALKAGLSLYDRRLAESELENVQPDFNAVYKQGAGFACFATTAKNELKLDHKKLIGSAQRKLGDKVLQHGSILCGNFHERITDYLNLSTEGLEKVKSELVSKTITIETITGEAVEYDRLIACMKAGFQQHYDMQFENDDYTQKLVTLNEYESI